MTEETCLNCNSTNTQRYELLLRGNDHSDVPLCDECYEAIQSEIADGVNH